MRPSKKKQQELDRLMEKTLRRCGVTRLRNEKRKPAKVAFPSLRVEQRTPPCGNGFGDVRGRKELPVGAKQFPVGLSHKQGYMLITRSDNLSDMGGRKT